ncbi:hypothetical protein P175DRAFT_0504099 [Aspergillus ochraceoroseus IBT 24754]|uniref:Glycosyltransferase family 31 protein n=3 Tax=Aspergillus subgen. Nidulantes TaxID=2720870 RepID=A0A0F8WCP6_9EURO|nr:uncharacterized protein P175DRAFT_0504099 [Aspergillus ochraceoroseus IBT 24754]KKK14915.1 hypothetical protein AOCH_001207 [Aspergillus ochraceoroseus]KKK15625.1 hypothetical protein ARAM_006226 [Aspergillus rambellii]PTU18199.1 hypothetical protein P175DRAFT_0504099 [Aspergillus ochraceoroseus IBT 24754]
MVQQLRLLLHHPFQQRIFRSWKILTFIAGCLFGCIVLLTYTTTNEFDSFSDPGLASSFTAKNLSSCFVDLNLLRLHAYNSSSIDYARLNIAVTRTDNFTAFADSLDVPLPTYHTVRLDIEASREAQSEETCATSVTIEAPAVVARPDASHMLFGVVTSLEKLEDSLDAFAHWAGSTNARIMAIVDPGNTETRQRIEQRANELHIRLTMVQNEDTQLDQYFSLVRILYQHRDHSTQWAVLIDEDTFFPSMKNLVDRLASYDSTLPQYIGGLTEDLAQLYGSGYMAYGGAGVFLSMPLLEELQRVFEMCYSFQSEGDRMLASCIYAHTNAKFTWEQGLHQLDLHGDASGFFESGRPLPLSVHHWKSWFHADMVALGRVADICGDECLLRRWHLSGEWFLVNGYSIIQDATLWNNPRPMEQTWKKSKYKGSDPFAYSLGPLRRLDPDKVSFRLVDVVQELDQVRQIYMFNETSDKPPQVLEVVWTVKSEDGD